RDQIGSARVRFSDEHQLLLTSDGLHGLLTDDEMREIIQESDGLQAAVNGLFDLAMERGGTDNISAILVAHAHAPDLIEA
ncbi:MAG: hypothetical protein KJO85_01205, partial [Gammaproteobacteria bacterium]|nr:hypothetical protein [Gammaproteobacteria bacterium]